jgi:hypothetical protein
MANRQTQQLRQLTRLRITLGRQRATAKNQLQAVLHAEGFQRFGATVWAMAGEKVSARTRTVAGDFMHPNADKANPKGMSHGSTIFATGPGRSPARWPLWEILPSRSPTAASSPSAARSSTKPASPAIRFHLATSAAHIRRRRATIRSRALHRRPGTARPQAPTRHLINRLPRHRPHRTPLSQLNAQKHRSSSVPIQRVEPPLQLIARKRRSSSALQGAGAPACRWSGFSRGLLSPDGTAWNTD